MYVKYLRSSYVCNNFFIVLYYINKIIILYS